MNERTKINEQTAFLDSLKYLNTVYTEIVIFSILIAAAGIFVAIQLVLWIGVAIAIAGALFYAVFTRLMLKVFLGMSYQSTSGAITITKICAKDQTETFVPRRLLWVNVTKLGDGAFMSESADLMRSVHLPATLTEIGKNIFDGCSALKTVYFEGTQEEWEKIKKDTDFDGFELVFCDPALYSVSKKRKKKSAEPLPQEAPTNTEDNA